MLVLVLDRTQCLQQGAGGPPAMLRGRMTGFPKNWVPGPPERQDKRWIQFAVPIDCGTPTTCMLYPFGATRTIITTINIRHDYNKTDGQLQES